MHLHSSAVRRDTGFLARRARTAMNIVIAVLLVAMLGAGISWVLRQREHDKWQRMEARVKRHAALDALRKVVLAVDAEAARLSDARDRDRLLLPLIDALREAEVDIPVEHSYDDAFRLNLLGRLLQRCEQYADALQACEEALGLLQRLPVAPEETMRRDQLEVELNGRVGELALRSNDPERAMSCFMMALQKAKEVYETAPNDRQLHCDYALALKRVADVMWWDLQSYEAVNYYPPAVRQLRMIVSQQPKQAELVTAWLQCLESWASCSLDIGEVETACSNYEELLRYVQSRKNVMPDLVPWMEYEFAAHHGLADAFSQRGDAQLVKTHCQAALSLVGIDADPIQQNPHLTLDLSAVYAALVAQYINDQQWPDARVLADARHKLLVGYQQRYAEDTESQVHLAHCLASMANLSWQEGQPEQAEELWTQVVTTLQQQPMEQRSALAHETLFDAFVRLSEACRHDGRDEPAANWLQEARNYLTLLSEQRVVLDINWLQENKKWLQDQAQDATPSTSP